MDFQLMKIYESAQLECQILQAKINKTKSLADNLQSEISIKAASGCCARLL